MPGLIEASAAIQEHSRGRRWKQKASLWLMLLGLLILCLEVGLRLSGSRAKDYAAHNSELLVELCAQGLFAELPESEGRYGLRPGARAQAGGVEYAISKHGTRGLDFEREKPAHERRLLILGDGAAMGLGCKLEDTLGERLVAMANSRAQESAAPVTWRAINAGVPGYHSAQQLADLSARGLGFDPDLVLLFFNPGDLEGLGFFLDSSGGLQRDALPLSNGLRSLLWKSHLYGWIASWHRSALQAGAGTDLLAQHVPYAWTQEHNQAATRRALASMADRCREAKVDFFLLDQALGLELEQAEAKALATLQSWGASSRSELQLAGYSLSPQNLSPLSAGPSSPGLALSSEAHAQAARSAFLALGELGLLP